jgi:hypothetical protein
MATFSENWRQCMGGKGLPVPSVEDVSEAIEFLHVLNLALENAGGGAEVTIESLIASGALGGIGEGSLVILGGIAQTAAAFYIHQCISCLSSVTGAALKSLFAQNELPDFVVAELESQGFELANEAVG